MALPWMESLRVWGDEPQGRARRERSAGAPGRPVLRATASTAANGGPRAAGASMELGKVLAPLADFREKMLFIRGLLQRRGAEGQHPQLADGQPALGRAAGLGRRDPLGHELRPVARADARPVDQGAEPGAGLREVEPVGAQELLDALQLAHLVDLADDADAARALSGAGLRPAVPGRGRARRQERARRRALRRPRLPPRDQHDRPAQARRISRLGPRGRAADRARRQDAASCKAGGRRSTSPTSRARPTAFRRTSASTCG